MAPKAWLLAVAAGVAVFVVLAAGLPVLWEWLERRRFKRELRRLSLDAAALRALIDDYPGGPLTWTGPDEHE